MMGCQRSQVSRNKYNKGFASTKWVRQTVGDVYQMSSYHSLTPILVVELHAPL